MHHSLWPLTFQTHTHAHTHSKRTLDQTTRRATAARRRARPGGLSGSQTKHCEIGVSLSAEARSELGKRLSSATGRSGLEAHTQHTQPRACSQHANTDARAHACRTGSVKGLANPHCLSLAAGQIGLGRQTEIISSRGRAARNHTRANRNPQQQPATLSVCYCPFQKHLHNLTSRVRGM